MEIQFTASNVKIFVTDPFEGVKEEMDEGTYSVSDNTITMVFGQYSETVTVSGNRITMDIDGEKIVFVKK